MDEIVKLNVSANIREKSYVTQLILLMVVYSVVFVQIIPGLGLNNQEKNLVFVLQYMFFIMNLGIFSTMLTLCLSNICITEKACKRIEFYLANKVCLNKIFSAYSLSAFILGFLGVILFDVAMFIYFSVMRINVFDAKFLLFIAAIMVLCLAISFILNALVFILQNPMVIKNIMFMSSFVLIFGGGYLLKPLLMFNLGVDIITLITIAMTILALIIFFGVWVIKKNFSCEKIILSMME